MGLDTSTQALAILQALVAAGVLVGAWSTPLKGDRVLAFWHGFPRFSGFVAGGFGFDAAFSALLRGLLRVGKGVDAGTHQKLWGSWLPSAFAGTVRILARPSFRADVRIRRAIERGAAGSADFPGKLAQLVQGGDVQWYLFFAIGCASAILIHFWVKL